MKNIDINCDIGEFSDKKTFDRMQRVLPHISSGNVACGFHAGSAQLMRQTMNNLVINGIGIGAHPSFADKKNFGRKEIYVDPILVYDQVLYQISAAAGIAKVAGGFLAHVKPHGALYNMAAREVGLAEAVVNAVWDFDKNLILYGLSGSLLVKHGRDRGLMCASEVFVDRTYQDDGSLTPRQKTGAVITDVTACLDQMLSIIQFGKVISTNGVNVALEADTICLHGDNIKAPTFAREISEFLKNHKVNVSPICR